MSREHKQWSDRAAAASNFMSEHNLKDGFAIVYSGEAAGWARDLNRPSGWTPGCIAISPAEDMQYVAVGGNDYDGANAWEVLPHPESKQPTGDAA